MAAKSKKSKLRTKTAGTLNKYRLGAFALVFAVIGTGLILATHATSYNNPATQTYNVTLPPPGCTPTKSGSCSPDPGGGGQVLYGPANKSASYVLSGVGPGRYNLDFSYSIPQIIGVYDYGYLSFNVNGSIVNIGQATSGQHHYVLYGNSPSTTTTPITGTETYTSFGVKWPKSDIHITVGYNNTLPTTLKITAIQLRPQKSQSGWTCNASNVCSPSPDYVYYFPPNTNIPSTSPGSSSTPSSQSPAPGSSSPSPQGSSQGSGSTKTTQLSPDQPKSDSQKGKSSSTSQLNSDSSQNANQCSRGNIFGQVYCHARSAVRSFFSLF